MKNKFLFTARSKNQSVTIARSGRYLNAFKLAVHLRNFFNRAFSLHFPARFRGSHRETRTRRRTGVRLSGKAQPFFV